MKMLGRILSGAALLMTALCALPAAGMADEVRETEQTVRFSTEELNQLVASIALYPDALVAQILMAATYPLEVVEAERWLGRNPQLSGQALDAALQEQPWDPSVKALCHFPGILASMSDKLDQTRTLGDAFLEQEQEVMATIQALRRTALQQGNLKSGSEQTVTVEPTYIRIEAARPGVVYVPVYDPAVVYGAWWYPAYPPYVWYYPSGVYGNLVIGFGPPVFLGVGYLSWVWFDWGAPRIRIDGSRTIRFHRPPPVPRETGPVWHHDPRHRKGVAYRTWQTGERFGARPPGIRPPLRELRAPQYRPPQASPAPERLEKRPPAAAPALPQRPPTVRDSPFRGVGEGGFERRAAERGGSSSRGIEAPRRNRVPGNTAVKAPVPAPPRAGQVQQPAPGVSTGAGRSQRPASPRQEGGGRR
ncbi:DUF3300 domain-containing protein [Trichlorobacter ammonificans]|uniref:DUF3300 domain-containing protein n=1 Tax=Trichlorobacter ammonificans TaxID=2916410 RepID=A0ABM9D4R7_9BACT|nr:DUF3300 domain-containing protein [Trichlorobacter ammonificans]CAH2030249.1 conserved exported protein of unknown function [Trichlorobacter ammonificans]